MFQKRHWWAPVVKPRCNAFDHCNCSRKRPDVFNLVLRRWHSLHESSEFRVFVRDGQLIGISQRQTSGFFEHLLQEEDWGWRLTPQLLLNERETPIAMLDQRCVPNPQRSSWILFWLSWYKIAFRFDVTATVFYLHSKNYVKLLEYRDCYHTMLLGWFSMFCNAIQLF